MKKYNKSISIEIQADVIADQLAEQFNGSKLPNHRKDALVDGIVGPMVSNNDSNALKHLYFALSQTALDAPIFSEKDKIACTKKVYTYRPGPVEDEKPFAKDYMIEERVEIGPCTLLSFDTYRNYDKYEIGYTTANRHGNSEEHTKWVNPDYLMSLKDWNRKSDIEVASMETNNETV